MYENRILDLQYQILDLKTDKVELQKRLDYYSGYDVPYTQDESSELIKPKLSSPRALRRRLEEAHRIKKEPKDDGARPG